jgi:phytoene dehydrogenase-like protein
MLCGLGQEIGYPFPEGGAGQLTAALVRRLAAQGGDLRCSTGVARVTVRDGCAVGVRTTEGEEINARRAVLADVDAPALYRDLLADVALPGWMQRALDRFQYDHATVKVDWTLDGPIPWEAEGARRAGTVHIADGMDGLNEMSAQLTRGLIPRRPFLVMGQYSMADPSRCPSGKETAWAYTHVPQQIRGDARDELTGTWDEREAELFTRRIEDEIEQLAPGFRELVRGRHVFTPDAFKVEDENLVGGAVNGGTARLRQQLFLRPVPGFARPETPVERLYLASSAAHPGGGVHGAPGANAAHAAIAARGIIHRVLRIGTPR